jgi:uroporphyrinogen-III decarboxylase
MTDKQWQELLECVAGTAPATTPVGFIVDSPWIPGWYGCSTLDYFTSDSIWFEANRRVVDTFPTATFLPGFWSEYGMCTEPSAFGARCRWEEKNLPHAERIIADIESPFQIHKPDPRKDGLLPFVTQRLKHNHDAVRRLGHEYRIAVARGPLNIASFLAGTTELMMGLKINEGPVLEMLDTITDFLIDWLGVQLEMFPSMDGIFLLDDLIGFLGPQDFEQIALPRLKRIYDAFPVKLKFLHNDANGIVCAPFLSTVGVNLFNFSHEHAMDVMRRLTGGQIALLGNIPPRDVLAAGTPEQIAGAAAAALATVPDRRRIILSCGGGIPQNVSTAQLNALIAAATA